MTIGSNDLVSIVNKKSNKSPPRDSVAKQSQTFKSSLIIFLLIILDLAAKTGYVDLDHLDKDTPISDTNSVLEFLIISLAQCLSLTTRQVHERSID